MRKGFTLIELLVVISVMAILSTGALAAYRNYSNAQVLQSTANEFYDTLQSAKTEAQSQVKPTQCAGMTLNNYNVAYTGSGSQIYSFNASCTDSSGTSLTQILITKQLPSGYTITDSSGNNIVSFNVLSAGVSFGPGITLSSVSINVNAPNGSYKTITVYANGEISISN